MWIEWLTLVTVRNLHISWKWTFFSPWSKRHLKQRIITNEIENGNFPFGKNRKICWRSLLKVMQRLTKAAYNNGLYCPTCCHSFLIEIHLIFSFNLEALACKRGFTLHVNFISGTSTTISMIISLCAIFHRCPFKRLSKLDKVY